MYWRYFAFAIWTIREQKKMRKFLFALLFFSLSVFAIFEENASVFTNELNRASALAGLDHLKIK